MINVFSKIIKLIGAIIVGDWSWLEDEPSIAPVPRSVEEEYKELIISNWQKMYTEDNLRKFGLELEDFTVEDDRIGCRFGIDMVFDPLAEYPFVISNQQNPLCWLDRNREYGRILLQLYLALCFREKYLKFENPEAFNKHKIVDGNKTNIFALSLLDPVTNVEELVNCFREITAFFRSDLKININPLIKISFDGVRSTATTIGGLKVFSDDSCLILVEYLDEIKEFHLYQNEERSHGISTVLRTNSIDLVYFALRVFNHDYFGVRNVFYLDKITD